MTTIQLDPQPGTSRDDRCPSWCRPTDDPGQHRWDHGHRWHIRGTGQVALPTETVDPVFVGVAQFEDLDDGLQGLPVVLCLNLRDLDLTSTEARLIGSALLAAATELDAVTAGAR